MLGAPRAHAPTWQAPGREAPWRRRRREGGATLQAGAVARWRGVRAFGPEDLIMRVCLGGK